LQHIKEKETRDAMEAVSYSAAESIKKTSSLLDVSVFY